MSDDNHHDDVSLNLSQLDIDILARSEDIPVYEEDIDYVEAEYIDEEDVDFTQIECTPQQSQVQDLLFALSDIDMSDETRDQRLQQLYDIQPNLVLEYVQNLCTSYEENQSSILRSFIKNLIKTCDIIHFIVKVQAAESIKDKDLLFFLLNQLMQQKTLDVEIIVACSKLKAVYKEADMILPVELYDVCRFILQHTLIKYNEKVLILQECAQKNNMLPFIRHCKLNDPRKWNVYLLQLLISYNDLTADDLIQAETQMDDDISKGVLYDFYLSLNPEYEVFVPFINKAKAWFEDFASRGFYNNDQNVHHVSHELEAFLDILLSVDVGQKSIQEHFDNLKNQTQFKSNLCQLALQRLGVDMSVYGKSSMNLKQIFVRCMLYIHSRSDDQELLTQRMAEELEDAAVTCSSGHLIRLMNVFSGIQNFVKIDPHLELRHCIFHRLQKAIESMPEDKRDLVLEILMEDDHEKKDNSLIQHMYQTFAEIHDQLQNEYVGQSLLTLQQFTEHYRESVIAFSLQSK